MKAPIVSDSKAVRGSLVIVSAHAAETLAPAARCKLAARIGAAIKMARSCRGLSLVALARESGLPRTSLQEVEDGLADLRVYALCSVERALGAAPGFVLRTVR